MVDDESIGPDSGAQTSPGDCPRVSPKSPAGPGPKETRAVGRRHNRAVTEAQWKDHDAYQHAFDRVLRDLKAKRRNTTQVIGYQR